MTTALLGFERDTNRVFGACIDIQNTTRALGETMFEMELLARNGVAKAARLAAGQGKPLLALAEILAGLPRDMRTEVDALERHCHELSQRTADASHRVRLLGAFVEGVREIEARASGDPAPVVRRVDETREAVIGHLAASNRLVTTCDENLDQLRRHGLTARYLAQHIEIEASQIQGSGAFVGLAREIHATIDHLESVLVTLRGATRESAERLRSLRERLEAA